MFLKRVLPILIIVLVVFNWQRIQNLFVPPPDFTAAHGGKPILYSTSWCGYCKQLKSLLNEEGVEFVELDIETSKEAAQQFRALSGRAVPLMQINGSVVHGFDPERVFALLAEPPAD